MLKEKQASRRQEGGGEELQGEGPASVSGRERKCSSRLDHEGGGGAESQGPIPVSVGLQMANDSTETSEAGEEEEDHEGDSENKERMPFIQ